MEDEWLELVSADILELLEGTVLEDSGIYPVSAVTGEGLPELVNAMDDLLGEATPKRDVGRPRLPIDRAFTISGFGTVVTGTLIDGSLKVGQEVELAISGKSTRIRGIQTHREKQDVASPGTRVAANLIGISQDEIQRGEVLTTSGWLRPTTAIDVRLRVIPDAPLPLKHNMFVTVHSGSNEVIGRLRLLEGDMVSPGETTWAQLKLESPLAVVKGDYYVIRSNQTTLGGGNIVETNARRHRRNNAALLDRLAVMEMGSDRDVLLQTIEGSMPSEFRDLVHRANMQPDAAKAELQEMVAEGSVIKMGTGDIGPGMHFYTASGWERVASKARSELESYYSLFPLRKGAPKEEIRSRLGMTANVFNHALLKLEEDGVISENGALLGLPDYEPKMSDEQKRAVASYLEALESSPYSPPTDAPLDADILNILSDEGKVVRVSESVVFSSAAYREMLAKISSHIRENGEITVAEVRDMFDTSRKYALALMDYLDAQRITRRVGDARVLR